MWSTTGVYIGSMLFTLLMNDIDKSLKTCEMTLCAVDSLLYVAGRKFETIAEKLNSDQEQIATWFVQNNLVVNLKKTMTECVLYCTRQRTSRSKPMEIKINQTRSTNQIHTSI